MSSNVSLLRLQDRWQNIRNTRNKFSHDYPDDGEKNAALINVAYEAAEEMYNILAGIEQKLKAGQPTCELGKILPAAYPKQASRC